jgi:hypothetical protein
MVTNSYAVSQWSIDDPESTDNAADIGTIIGINNDALDRVLAGYREECALTYASASTLTIEAGELGLSNSAGTTRRMRRNTASTTVAWTDIDAGGEATSTTYYVYGIADTDAATFTAKITTSSTAPTGVTYYRRLGSFYNDASGNIVNVVNDNYPLSVYDSGWFSVAADTDYVKTHNLGTTELLTNIYFSTSSDGSSPFMVYWDYDDLQGIWGGVAMDITATQYTVNTANEGVAINPNNNTLYTTGYYRAISQRIEN